MTAEPRHLLVRAMYEPDGYARRSPRDIRFEALPLTLRQLLVRASRLARLVEIDAPANILEAERRLVAESALAFNAYVLTQVLEPARQACEAQFQPTQPSDPEGR